MEEIKPCPFCGGEAELKHHGSHGSLQAYCICTLCGAKGAYFIISTAYSCDGEAIEAWNRRANDESD